MRCLFGESNGVLSVSLWVLHREGPKSWPHETEYTMKRLLIVRRLKMNILIGVSHLAILGMLDDSK